MSCDVICDRTLQFCAAPVLVHTMTEPQGNFGKKRKIGRRSRNRTSENLDSLYKNIQAKTGFSEVEIKSLHVNFLEICPDGFMSKKKFLELSKRAVGAQVNLLSDSLFRVFDADESGTIDFEEYLLVLRAADLHSLEDKLRWIFDVFDKDGSGSISPDEIESLLGSLFDISGQKISETDLKAACKDVMDAVDSDGDGEITKQEFVENALRSETIAGIVT